MAKTSLVTQQEIQWAADTIDLDGVSDGSVSGMIQTGEVLVEVATEEDAAIAESARDRLRTDSPVSARIVVGSGVPQPNADIYGGAALGCTAGFSVKSKANENAQGVLTAGHCNDTQAYQGTNLPLYGIPLNEGRTDAQWHTTPGYTDRPWMQDPYYDATPYYRKVTATKSRADQALEAYVCKYGKATFWTCGYIITKSYRPICDECPENATATYIRIRNNNLTNVAKGGDSGATWIHGTVAVGIHSGSVGSATPGKTDAYYAPINFVQIDLNVTVKKAAP